MFLALKTGTGLSCTTYKIPVNFSLSLDVKPGTSSLKKGTENFSRFEKTGKMEYLKRYYFFSGKFSPE